MMNYGFIKSDLDGSEHVFKPSKSISLPSEYSYLKYLPSVLNQRKQTHLCSLFIIIFY